MPSFLTACPRNCYSTCTLRVELEDGRLRRVEPYQGNRATPEGACLKGLSYVERVHSPDRILHPLRRKGDKFERITWDEALGVIGEKLLHLRASHGPKSILYYAASGTKGMLNAAGSEFWKAYGGCTSIYGDLCWPSGLEATRLTLGENKHNAPWDLENARLIVLWGKNPAETNVHQMPFIESALSAGGKLVVVDPRRTESSERAGMLIQPRPGTDAALALAVAHLLVRENAVDTEFVDKHVSGFSEFASSLGAFTPSRAAKICGLSVGQIEKLADLLAGTRPASIVAGFGMQRYTNSGQTMRAIIALLAITGNIGKPGAGWVYANLQSHIFEPKDPVASFPPKVDEGPQRVSISTARLGADMLAQKNPPLRAAWVERGNPLNQNPESGTVKDAFEALDFVVVVEQFLTDTARAADIILPAKSFLEQSDVITAYWHPYIQLKPKVMESPGEVMPETEIYRALGRHMDLDLEGKIPAEEEIESYLEERLVLQGLSLDELRVGPQLPPGYQEIAFEDYRFDTPSGKIELLSQEARERWGLSELPDFTEAQESSTSSKFPLQLLTPNTKNRIHSQFGDLKLMRALEPELLLTLHPADAEPRGIAEDDRLRVFNDRGDFEAKARLNFGLRPGCVSAPNGWWRNAGTVNDSSAGRETDMGHGAAFHDNFVDVELLS